MLAAAGSAWSAVPGSSSVMSALLLPFTGLLCGILVPYTSAQLPREIGNGCDLLWEQNIITRTCYQFNLQSVISWKAARTSCQAQGGDLLSITDLAEQNYISEKLKNEDTMLWIGLNQLDGLVGWQWSDGTALALVNWKTNSTPWSHERRHCGAYYAGGEHKWRSVKCESKLPYACKKYLKPRRHDLYEENWKYHPTQCESNWIPYNQRCCGLLKEGSSWSEASAACLRHGGELMAVNSLADVEFLLHLLSHENASEAWIGMSSRRRDPVEFRRWDDSAVTFSSWQRHEPNISLQDNDLCVSAQRDDGNWRVRPCNRKLFTVCQKTALPETMDVSDEQCAESWVRHGAYCYGTNLRDQTFREAVSDSSCPLATITNRFEQAFISSLISSKIIPGDSYFWIALQDINMTGEYSWLLNGRVERDVSFTNWDTQEPSHNGGCVVLSSAHYMGHWKVKDCTGLSAKSLCKKPLRVNVEREPASHEGNIGQACAPSWDSEPQLHHCYKIFHDEKLVRKRTWQEAEDLCQDFGAHLVSLSHIEEKQFVKELLHSMFNGDETRTFWIGLNKRNPSSPGSWEWSDGSPVVSSFWHDAIPNDVTKNCAAYRADMQLVPLNCNTPVEWICKILKGVIPKNPGWYITEKPWVFHQGQNYLFYDTDVDFAAAEFICGWMQSGLTSIHTENEQDFIHRRITKTSMPRNGRLSLAIGEQNAMLTHDRSGPQGKVINNVSDQYQLVPENRFMSKENKKWWIGLVNEDKLQRWGDGSSVIYNNWKTDPPSNINNSGITAGEEQCTYIESDTGLWSKSDCCAPHSVICKRTVMYKIEKHYTPVVKDHGQEHGICPRDWLYYGNKCFLVYKGGIMMDWYAAFKYCKDYGGGLATIPNEIEQAFIVMQLFREMEGFWIGFSKDDFDLWEEDTVDAYNNWSPTQHNEGHENDAYDQNQLCAVISANHDIHPPGKWYLEKCSSKGYGFICEKKQDIPNPTISLSDMFPVSETMEYGDKTYRIISGNMSWYEASTACQKSGERLISITDQFQQSFVTILVHRLGYPHWIGYFSAHSDDDFRWTDGSMSMFTSWADEESPLDGSCVYIDTNGYWKAEDCDRELQGALCLPSTGTRGNDHSDECPEGWTPFNHSCYSIYSALHNKLFNEAEEICKEQGSKILTVLNEEEKSFIHYQVKTLTSVQSIWLSRIIPTSKGEVAWSDGSLVCYSNWNEETTDVNGLVGEYCASMWMDDGTWRLAHCYERRGFVCKKGGDGISCDDTRIYTTTDHVIIPIAVASTMVITVLLIFSWYLLKRKRCLSSPNIQRLQHPEPGPETDDVELCIPITDLNNSENR